MIAVASLIQKIGAALSTQTLSAARVIISKAGLRAANNFFDNITVTELRTLTKKELLDRFSSEVKQVTKTQIDDAIFSKSNAKKLANSINKSLDFIEDNTRKTLINHFQRVQQRKLADTLKTLSTPGMGPFSEGIDVLGIEVGGKFIAGKKRSQAYNRARDISLEALRITLVQKNKSEAFTVAYIRGLLGHTTASTIENVLLASPRAVLGAPKARAFFRTLQTEVEYLRTTGQVRKAAQLAKAINTASRSAGNIYLPSDPLLKTKATGYISGRLTIPIASEYVFVDGDVRKEKMKEFQNSIKPYAKKKIRTYVESYTRSDGTRVKGHYRELEVSPI